MSPYIANAELDELYRKIAQVAQKLLDQHGEFYPFAMIVSPGGELRLFSTETDEAQPDPTALRSRLGEALGGLMREGELRAFAVASDVLVDPPYGGSTTDAIQVTLRHSDGEAMDVFMPYESNGSERRYGAIFVSME